MADYPCGTNFAAVPRVFIAILLILSLSYQCFLKLGIVVWYEYNKDYIAQNLCENRAQPEKKCCGKCYLNKQLKKADQGETGKTTLPAKWNTGEVVLYTIPTSIEVPIRYAAYTARIRPHNHHFHPLHIPDSIFHPPSC